MDDRLLAGRASTGDLDSFGQLYDRYFHRVYDFAWRVLRNREAAADATRETFMRARRELPSLAKSSSVAAALFMIAHGRVLERAGRSAETSGIGAASHEEAFGTFDVPDATRVDRPELVGGDHELAALVWEALTALNPQDYALLDLHIRQGLDSADLARVLGASKREAATLVSRMKSAAAGVITGYVVARRGAAECPALQQVLAPFDVPPYTDTIRRVVDEHIAGCRICQQTRDAIGADTLAVLGAFAPVTAPMTLKSDIWRELSAEWRTTPRMSLAAAGFAHPRGASPYGEGAAFATASGTAIGLSRYGDDGGSSRFGPTAIGGGDWDRNRIMWFAGGAIVLVVLAFAGAAAVYGALGGGNNGSSRAAATAPVPRTSTPAGTPAGVGVTTPTAKPTSSPTEGPSETPTPPPPPTALPVTDTPLPPPPPPPATATTAPAATATPKPRFSPTAGVPTKCPPGGCPTKTP